MNNRVAFGILFIALALAVISIPFMGFFHHKDKEPTYDTVLAQHAQVVARVDSEQQAVNAITGRADSIQIVYIPKIKKEYEAIHDSIVSLPTDEGIGFLATQLSQKDSLGSRYLSGSDYPTIKGY